MKLGTTIRAFRELNNLKQKFVAEKLGISRRTYVSLENKETPIPPARIDAIAKLFDVSVDEILNFNLKAKFLPYGQNKAMAIITEPTIDEQENEKMELKKIIQMQSHRINELKMIIGNQRIKLRMLKKNQRS